MQQLMWHQQDCWKHIRSKVMATKKFLIEVEEGMTKCGQCPDGFPCGGFGPIHCCDFNLATMKITEMEDK